MEHESGEYGEAKPCRMPESRIVRLLVGGMNGRAYSGSAFCHKDPYCPLMMGRSSEVGVVLC